jgi:UDP-sugar transporter A1/2/3
MSRSENVVSRSPMRASRSSNSRSSSASNIQKSDSGFGAKIDSLLRYGTLIILVLQTTATVLLLRYSRTRPGQPYLASTAVMLNEVCKFTVCVLSLYAQRGFSVRRCWRAFRDEILGKPSETVKLILPSGLYCLQNNLLFVALTNLDAATYQVIIS